MSYLVLARKWRPRRFAELVGQEHVVRALSNALDSGRVHHAFLFTGTRGVGKTTIARIFAKSLNCEIGVGAEPCGSCNACQTIDAGRFVDLIEIDAASNTGVDDIRDVIENAQYMPSSGRYKVYLIDEVHMLTRNAFNALLKTLEEPPEHVKFLLATTDPQKLPVTVLSRCLQFNLKRLTVEQIALQITSILAAEEIEAEPAALQMLARAADGSLRDGLSLLDQAIAFGGGALTEADVRSMLGSVDQTRVGELLEALIEADGNRLLQTIEQIATFAPDFGTALDALAEALHRLQLAQLVPGAEPPGDGLDYAVLSGRVAPELVQLWYQMATSGRRDLPYAPSERIGFEMSLLRMLAFVPGGGGSAGAGGQGAAAGSRNNAAPAARGRSAAPAVAAALPQRVSEPPGPVALQADPPPTPPRNSTPSSVRAPDPERSIVDQAVAGDDDSVQAKMARLAAMLDDRPRRRPITETGASTAPPEHAKPSPVVHESEAVVPTAQATPEEVQPAAPAMAQQPDVPAVETSSAAAESQAKPAAAHEIDTAPARLLDHEDWLALIGNSDLRGPVRELAYHAIFDAFDGVRLRLALDARFDHLRETATVAALQQALQAALGHLPQIHFTTATRAIENETLHQRNQRERDQRQVDAEAVFRADPQVQRLVNDHGARIVPGSIRPSDPL